VLSTLRSPSKYEKQRERERKKKKREKQEEKKRREKQGVKKKKKKKKRRRRRREKQRRKGKEKKANKERSGSSNRIILAPAFTHPHPTLLAPSPPSRLRAMTGFCRGGVSVSSVWKDPTGWWVGGIPGGLVAHVHNFMYVS